MTRSEDLKRQINKLVSEYGKGVRPGWVSTELALLWAELDSINDD